MLAFILILEVNLTTVSHFIAFIFINLNQNNPVVHSSNVQWYTLEPRCYISKTAIYLRGIAEKLQSSTAKLISKFK